MQYSEDFEREHPDPESRNMLHFATWLNRRLAHDRAPDSSAVQAEAIPVPGETVEVSISRLVGFLGRYARIYLKKVMQDKEGVIYVGNVRNGLIEFDGQRVRRVLQNGKPMSAFVKDAEADSKNTIYLGLNGTNFGYLEKNKFGQNEYISLSDKLPKKDEVTSTFWGLVVHHDTLFFQTENAVYLFKDKKYLRSYKF